MNRKDLFEIALHEAELSRRYYSPNTLESQWEEVTEFESYLMDLFPDCDYSALEYTAAEIDYQRAKDRGPVGG